MFVHPLHLRVLPVWPQVFADGSHEFSTPVHTRTHVEPDTDRGRAADERERRGLLASEEAEEVGVELVGDHRLVEVTQVCEHGFRESHGSPDARIAWVSSARSVGIWPRNFTCGDQIDREAHEFISKWITMG